MKKIFSILLCIFILFCAYLIDLFFHIGYTLFFINLLLSPLFLALVFFILIGPSYFKTCWEIKEKEQELGLRISAYYFLDKIISSLLIISSSFVIIFALGILLTGGMFIYILYLPQWWLLVLIPAFIPEFLLKKRRLNRLITTNL